MRFRAALLGRNPAIDAQDSVAVREPGIGQRILRIELNRLLEALDGQAQSGRRSLVPIMPSLEIQLVGLGVFGRIARRPEPASPSSAGTTAFTIDATISS